MTSQDEERMLRLLPHGLLAVATVVATAAAPRCRAQRPGSVRPWP
jgi:hypothetical protein